MNKSSVIAGALLVSVLSVTNPAVAEPQGGEVRAGSATIQQTLGTTTIEQLTDRAIIDWQRFNVSSGELVRFLQPNEMAVILNRVVGGDPSVIMGKLQANGQLFLVNPNGILFGAGSQVDVGSLVATTLSISNEDFLSGNYHFVQDPGFDLAGVINQGTITVSDEGYVVLTAPLVSNEGMIVANLGKVALGAGNEVTLNLDGRNLVSYQLSAAPAEGGTVVLTPEAVSNVLQGVVNDGSLVPAGSLVEENGELHLVGAEGTLVQAGAIQAGSVETHAGQVSVLTAGSSTTAPTVKALGRKVAVLGAIDASGASGGGTVLIGGPARGQGAEERALTTRVEGTVNADATEAGQGGTIVVWSEERTDITGSLSALGAGGEAGGWIETSSRDTIYLQGSLQAGDRGTWLLDPADVEIVAGPPAANQVQASAISTSLTAGTSVVVQSATPDVPGEDGNIRQEPDAHIVFSGAGNPTLTISTAGTTTGTIELEGTILTTGATGTLKVELLTPSANTSGISVLGNVETNGGEFEATTGGSFLQASDTVIDAGAGVVTISANEGILLEDVRGGTVTLTASNNLIDVTDVDAGAEVTATTGLALSTGTGAGNGAGVLDIDTPTVTASVTGTGDLNLSSLGTIDYNTVSVANGSASLFVVGGDLTATSVTATGTLGNIDLNSDTGHILLGSVDGVGTVQVVATAGTINRLAAGGVDVTGSALTLTSATGIGNAGTLAIDTGSANLSVTGAGVIDVAASGTAVDFVDVDTANGTITLTSSVNAIATDVIANGAANVNLTTTAGANLNVGDVKAVGDTITISAAGALEETVLTDNAADLTATSLSLAAGSGIGLVSAVELEAVTLTSASTTSGGIVLADTAGGLAVTNANAAGSLSLSAANTGAPGLFVDTATAGGDITLSTSGALGNITVNNLTAAGVISITSPSGSINEATQDGQVDLTASSLTLSANSGIGNAGALEVAVATLTTVASGSGVLNLADIGGGLTASSVTGNTITLSTTGGDLLVGLVDATNTVTLSSSAGIEESGGDGAADVDGSVLTLTSGTGIGTLGTLEINGTSLVASVSGTGAIDVTDVASVLNATDVSTTNGSISLATTNGILTATLVTANGAGSDVSLSSGAFGLLVGNVTANDVLTASAGATIGESGSDPDADMTATTLTLSASTGIASLAAALEINAVTLNATNNSGTIVLSDTAGGLVANSVVTSTAGNITLSAVSGTLDLVDVVANGAGTVTASTTGSGQLRVGSITAAGDAVTLTSAGQIVELSPDVDADITSASTSLTAATGISPANALELDITTLTLASVTGTGSLNLGDANGMVVTSATTADGNITLSSAAGNLSLTSVTAGTAGGDTAGGNITLTTFGDVLVGLVRATDNVVTVTAGDEILELTNDATADLTGASVSLTALTGIGSTTGNLAVDVDAVDLTAVVTGTGIVNLTDTLGGVNALNVSTINGNITLVGTNGDLLATSIAAGGGGTIALSTVTAGDIILDSVTTAGTVTLNSVDTIVSEDLDATADLSANLLNITGASDGVGTTGPLEIDVVTLTTAAIAAGGLNVLDTAGGLAVTTVTTNAGNMTLAATGGDLSVTTATVNGTNFDLTLATNTSGNVLVGAVAASGDDITVNSAGTIEELGPNDATADLTALNIFLTAATGIGGGGAVTPLEVDATNLTATATTGDIELEDTSLGFAVDATATDGDISLTARSGNVTTGNVAANAPGRTVTLTTTTTGNVLLGNVSSNTSVTVVSAQQINENGSDPGADLTAPTASLTGPSGIGATTAFEVALTTLTASAAGGFIDLTDVSGGLIATSVTNSNGAITLAADGGNLTAQNVVGTGASTVTLRTTTSGDVLVNHVDSTGDPVIIQSAGRILESGNDPDADISSTNLTLTSETGIGTAGNALEVASTTLLSGAVNQAGLLHLVDTADGLSVTSATTFNGSLTLVATGGNLTASVVTAGGAADVNLSTVTSGNVLVNTVTAAGDSVNITSAGSIEETSGDIPVDVTAASLNWSAATGAGAAGAIEVSADTLAIASDGGAINIANTAVAPTTVALAVGTAAGNLTYAQTGGMQATITDASTFSGAISLSNNADLVAQSVTAGGAAQNATLTATGNGDIVVGNVSAAGDAITLSAATGTVEESGNDPQADVTSGSLTISTANGIGTTGTLEVDITTLTNATTTAAGPISLTDTAGGMTVTAATSFDGDLSLTAAGGNLTVTNVTANNAGDIILGTTGSGDVLIGAATATGDQITVNSAGAIEEIGAGEATVDLTAGAVNLTAASGIGAVSTVIELNAASVTASTATGNLVLSNAVTSASTASLQVTGGPGNVTYSATAGQLLTVDNTSTADGSITVTNNADLDALGVAAGGATNGDLTLTVTGGSADVFLGSASGADAVTVTAGGTIQESGSDAGADLSGGTVSLQAAAGIGATGAVEVDVTVGLTALVTGLGNLDLVDTAGGLVATSVTTNNGDLALTAAGGDLVATDVEALGSARNVTLTTTGSGNLQVGSVMALLDTVTMSSAGSIDESGSDSSSDIDAANINLTAASGIGAGNSLELNATTGLTAAVTGAGAMDLTDTAGGLTVNDANTFDGSIALTARSGALLATAVTAGGSGAITLTTETSGNISVGNVTATDNLITVTSAGSILEAGSDVDPDLTGFNAVLAASSGIGTGNTLELNTNQVTANVTGAGIISLAKPGTILTVTNATTTNGSIDLAVGGGTLTIQNVVVGGAGNDFTATTTGGGGVRIDSLVAPDLVTITSSGNLLEFGNEDTADITATTAVLTSNANMTGLELDLSGTLTANITGVGKMGLVAIGDLEILSATTTNGQIRLFTESGNMTVHNAVANTAGILFLETRDSGDLLIDSLAAVKDVQVFAAGSVQELNPDPEVEVTTQNIKFQAGLGIGDANQIEIDGINLIANAGVGNVDVRDLAGGLQVGNTQTLDGNLNLVAVGGELNVGRASAGGTGRNITLSTTTSGDVRIGLAVALGDTVTVNSVGAILERGVDVDSDISGNNAILTAGYRVGVPVAPIEITTNLVTATALGAGTNSGVHLEDLTGTLVATVTTTNGPVTLVAHGNLTASNIVAGGANDVTLTTLDAGLILVNSITAGESVTLDSVSSVLESGTDPEVDILAALDSVIRANGGNIAQANALEVNITNGSLSVFATTAVSGVSVRIDGMVSPTNALIRLPGTPGQVLLNGVNQP